MYPGKRGSDCVATAGPRHCNQRQEKFETLPLERGGGAVFTPRLGTDDVPDLIHLIVGLVLG